MREDRISDDLVREKIQKLNLNPDLPEELELRPVTFLDLDRESQGKVIESYKYWWKHVLETEYFGRKWTPVSGHHMMRTDEVIRQELMKQFFVSSYNFPPGQMVLVKTIKNKDEPIIFTRAQPWCISPDNDYKFTWYEISGDGLSYSWLPTIRLGHIRKAGEYDELISEKPTQSTNGDLVLFNYALTKRHEKEFKVKGASKAAIIVNARYALKHGMGCRTLSPLNGYKAWFDKMVEDNRYVEIPEDVFTPTRFLQEQAFTPAKLGKKPDHFNAPWFHLMNGATIDKENAIHEGAREDFESGNYCVETIYF